MIKGKHVIFGMLGTAGIAGAAYLFNLSRLSAELEVENKAAIHKVTLSGLTIRIDVTLKNPTGGSINVKYPFVKLLYSDTTLGSSEVKDQNFDLAKFAEQILDPIYINLSFMSLASSVPALLKEYRSTGKFDLVIKIISTLNDTIPFSKTQNISIGSQKQIT